MPSPHLDTSSPAMRTGRANRLRTIGGFFHVGASALRRLAGALAFASLAAHGASFPAFSVTASSYVPGATSAYTFTYTTATNVPAGQYILYTGFPSGFTVAANCANTSITVNGAPQPCTVGMSPAGVYSWLAGTGVAVAPGSNVVIVLSNLTNAPTSGVKTFQWFRTANGSGVEIDSPATLPAVTLNALPSAASTAISGTAQFGQALTGSYAYSDAEADAQDTGGGGSSYRFVRSADNSVATSGDNVDVAAGATAGSNQIYTTVAADIGSTLFYCVTPRASSGSSPGIEACSVGTAISPAAQAITGFAPATPVVFGSAPALLTASGGASGSPVVFATTSAASICSVTGSTLTYVGVGVCNLTADQSAGGNYSAAPQVTASVTITAAAQAITGFAPAASVTLGSPPVTLVATGGASGSPVVFATTSAASICSVTGSTLTYVGVGVCNLTADQAAGGNYSAAPQLTASVTINAMTAIPTLSEWGTIILSGVLLAFGLTQLRRRGASAPRQ